MAMWRGETGLAWAFWGYWIGGRALIGLVGYGLLSMFLDQVESEQPLMFIAIGLALARLAWVVFCAVGIRRAANRFLGSKLWVALAYVALTIELLMLWALASGMARKLGV